MKTLLRLVFAVMLIVTAMSFTVSAQDDVVTTRADAPDPAIVQFTEVAGDFVRPLLVTHAGDGSNRLFVVEQGGRVWVIQDGERLETPFIDLSNVVSREANSTNYTERGLLGLAFHPNYEDNGWFFVNFTDSNGTTHIERYTVSADDPNRADLGTSELLITQNQPFPNHNGGHMAFGLDGYLYIAFGDGGAAGDPLGAGQDLSTWLGKIIRIDVNVDETSDGLYTIPDDNPFITVEDAKPEIWAYGLRNPWRFSFDRATGDLYIGDVGQNQWEEINFQPADSTGGANYGWNIYEGMHPYSGGAAPADMVYPVAEYDHAQGISVSAGYVYRGANVPELAGTFFYGDFGTGRIWSLWRDEGGNWRTQLFMEQTGITISSFGEDEAGELYVVDYAGRILRFDAAE